MQTFFFFLPIIAGTFIATQAGVNSQLRASVGSPVVAAFISFLVGTIVLGILILGLQQPIPNWKNLSEAGWSSYLGGFLGAGFVMINIVSAQRIGAGSLFALLVTGQLITALVYDQFGWLGFKQNSVTPIRIVGVVLLIAGAYLVSRR